MIGKAQYRREVHEIVSYHKDIGKRLSGGSVLVFAWRECEATLFRASLIGRDEALSKIQDWHSPDSRKHFHRRIYNGCVSSCISVALRLRWFRSKCDLLS